MLKIWAKAGILLLMIGILGAACQQKEAPSEIPTLFVPPTWTPSPIPPTDLPTATETASPIPASETPIALVVTVESPSFTIEDSPTPTVLHSATPTDLPTDTPSPIPTFIIGTVVAEGAGALARLGPQVDFPPAPAFFSGTIYELIGQTRNYEGQLWYQIRSAAGEIAWIPAEGALLASDSFIPELDIIEFVTLTFTPTATYTVSPTYTLTPSITPSPTDTPSPTNTVTATATLTPSFTPTFTPTLPPAANARIVGERPVNLRVGPDTSYRVLRTLPIDEPITLLGREGNSWYLARTYGADALVGWLPASFVQTDLLSSDLTPTWFGFASDDRSTVACGIRIDPLQESTWGNVPPRLPWVVVPFVNDPERFETLNAAFEFYDSVVTAYIGRGIEVMFALTPATYRDKGDFDWSAMSAADWTAFIESYAATVERIVQRYGGRAAGYLIWDVPSEPDGEGLAGVTLSANVYTEMVGLVAGVIRAYQRDSVLVLGGVSDPATLLLAQQISGRALPVSALALPLEGRPADTISAYQGVSGGASIWFTGLEINSETPDNIRETVEDLRIYHPQNVDAAIWGPWTGGLVDENGRPTAAYNLFVQICTGGL